jgi:Fe2+ transport system protein FeoA
MRKEGRAVTLDKLQIGKKSKITAVNGGGALRRHLLDMGLTPHTEVTIQKVAPMGDPIEIHLRGYELTLRKEDARNITVEEA